MPLTDTTIISFLPGVKTYKQADGLGLYLLICPNGSRYWRLDYRFGGKRKTLSMGVYPDVGLDLARERRDEARALLAEGINPAEVRKQDRLRTVGAINLPSLLFSSTESGGMFIESNGSKMLLSPAHVVALRAFLDATREPPPCH